MSTFIPDSFVKIDNGLQGYYVRSSENKRVCGVCLKEYIGQRFVFHRYSCSYYFYKKLNTLEKTIYKDSDITPICSNCFYVITNESLDVLKFKLELGLL